MGDTRGDIEAQDWFPPKADDPEREGTTTSLSQKSGHLKNKGATDLADRGEESVLHSELFVVPGAQNILRVLKALNFVQSAWCTELYKSAWGTLGLRCHIIVLDLTRSDHFIFSILLHHSLTPNQSRGIVIFFGFNFNDCFLFLFDKINYAHFSKFCACYFCSIWLCHEFIVIHCEFIMNLLGPEPHSKVLVKLGKIFHYNVCNFFCHCLKRLGSSIPQFIMQ